MLSQSCMSFFLLRNMKEKFLKNILAVFFPSHVMRNGAGAVKLQKDRKKRAIYFFKIQFVCCIPDFMNPYN